MNFTVKAFKIISINDRTTLEDYEKQVPNYFEAEKELIRLKSLGGYSNVIIVSNKKGSV